MSKHLDEIIELLGYAGVQGLAYRSNSYDSLQINAQTTKVLERLSPYAAYISDNKPFVLFFDEPVGVDDKKEIHKKVWNAQVPLAIFCGTATIKVYNGRTINKESCLLPEITSFQFDRANVDASFSFWDISNQSFWINHVHRFDDKKLNDELLDNLIFLTDNLKNTYNVKFATRFVLRLIFIRYLVDRGVNLHYSGFSSDVQSSRKALLALLDNASELYAFFAYLKSKFNGNLFELEDDNPSESISNSALQDVKAFLSANVNLPRGQYSLFNLYDFDIIPVELISNIYEILLGRETREKDNAFYTPKYLVDYILSRTIKGHLEINDTCRVLDPSCGSGVFLVDSYRRIIEKKLDGALYTENNEVLCKTLTDSIFGIDVNPVAIDVAIFSLYLAVLDYKNPKTLDGFTLPDLKKGNLFACDFFDEERLAHIREMPLDFIIGNPPWSDKRGMHIDYCEKHDYMKYMQDNDTCRSFVLRSKDFCSSNTKCCFVLHSKKMLYLQGSQSVKFRDFLLTKTEIKSIVELSSVRELIFKNAKAPAIIITYQFASARAITNRFEYISMKPNIFFRLFNIIVVEKNDVKNVAQKLLAENDWAWKTLVYGLTGDMDNIIHLKASCPSLNHAVLFEDPTLISGTGVQYNDGDRNPALHLVGRDMLHSNAIDHFFLDLDKLEREGFKKPAIHRPRNEMLFQAPYCLVMKGLDMFDYTMRAVFSDVDFVFKEAVYAIKGTNEQRAILHNIVGLLNSRAYSYFNLMLGSSLGIEREQRFFDEILGFPFLFSDDIAAQVENIQEKMKTSNGLTDGEEASDAIDRLNMAILEAYGLSENDYVDYALRIQIPQLTGRNNQNANRVVNAQDLTVYGQYFYDYLSEIFSSSSKYVKISIYPTVAQHYSAIEVVVLDQKPAESIIFIDGDTDTQKKIYAKLSAHKTNELFYAIMDVLYFEENSLYIIKPSYYKNWHPAIAKLDLADITDEILSGRAGGDD